MIVIDASVWVSLLLPDDINHVGSRAWFRRHLPAGELVIEPCLVFAEVAGAIARRIGNPEAGYHAITQMKRLRRLQAVEFDTPFAEEIARLSAALGLRGPMRRTWPSPGVSVFRS